MYISTNLESMDSYGAIVDQIRFTTTVRPESVPFHPEYGIRINGNASNIESEATSQLNRAINSLGIDDLSLDSIDIYGNNINLTLLYGNKSITMNVN